jgi:hypothetical protein
MKTLLPALALLLAISSHALADCAPRQVLKIVTAAEYPGTPADTFKSLPRTLYRLADRYGRLEEPRNPDDNLHVLVVISEPDIWMVNLIDNTGQHIVDPGPELEFHAPLLEGVDSKVWLQLEYGCEEPFMKAVGARIEKTASGATRYTHTAEGTTVSLTVANGKPQRIEVASPKLQYTLRYTVFETVADPPADLFKRPEKVTYEEAKQEE